MFKRTDAPRTNPDPKVVLHCSPKEHSNIRNAAHYAHKSVSDLVREALDLWFKSKHIPRHVLEGRG